jgi:hypothetical protein
MSATAERPRKRSKPDLDEPIRNRSVSSLSMITERFRQLHAAVQANDDAAVRFELRKLSTEALTLAAQETILPSVIARRMRIAATARPTGPR